MIKQSLFNWYKWWEILLIKLSDPDPIIGLKTWAVVCIYVKIVTFLILPSLLGYPQRWWWGSYCQGWTQTSSWNRTDKDRHRHGGVRQRRQARDGGREKQNHCQESSPRHPQDNNGDTGEKISSYPGWGQESWAQQSQADIPPRTKSCGWGKLSTYFKYMKSFSWWICSTTKICNLFGKSLSWRLNLKHWIFIYF